MSILESFVEVAPYINQLTNKDFAVSVCDLNKCLIYVNSEKQDHKVINKSPIVEDSVSYECITTGEKIVKRVDCDIFGFPYLAICLPMKDEKGNVIGSVGFFEAVDKQDLILALAENLNDTMEQFESISDMITDNTSKLKDIGVSLNNSVGLGEESSEINEKVNELINITREQININNYIVSLAKEVGERARKLKDSAEALGSTESMEV